MRVLFYGAGVIGSLYAVRLQEAGHEVSVVARGRRLADLRRHGIVLEEAGTGHRTAARVGVVQQLDPGDAYDLIVVAVRKNQLPPILPELARNLRTPDVLLMLNNAAGPGEAARMLGRGRLLLGFPGAGGTLEGHLVRYHVLPGWQQKTTFGEPDGRDTPRLARVVAAFREAGFPVAASPNMDAWLKTHAAWICPISCALYATGGDVHRMARTRDALILTIRSTRENFRALRRLGVPITPPSPNLLALGRMPEPALVPLLGHLLDTRTAETVVQSHATAARDEVGQLFGELVALARRAAVPTPATDRLRQYLLDPGAPPLPEGSTELPLDLRGATVGAAAGAVLLLLGITGFKRLTRY